MTIAILGDAGGQLAYYLAQCAGSAEYVLLMPQEGQCYDVLLAAPGVRHAPRCATQALVAHDLDAAALAGQVQAGTVITYGTEKSTLCLSSAADSCLVALQREVVTCQGQTMGIGELRLPGTGLSGEQVCGVAGALAACGWPGLP